MRVSWRVSWIVAAAAVLDMTTLGFASRVWAQETTRPNILFVLSDDHSAAFVRCYGNNSIRTPNLDKFAAEGMRFDRAYVASPQCVPSRSAMMTGQSPVRTGMTRFSAPLPADVVAYPELLRASGYYTGLCGRTFHLDGAAQVEASRTVFEQYSLRTFKNRVDYLPQGNQNRVQVPNLVRTFLDQVPKGKPWFLQVGYSDPHRPLDKNAISQPHDPASLMLPPHMPDTPLVREDLARYCDEVARFDGDFAVLLQILEERGLTKKTPLVVVMGDNGGALLSGKGTLYELGVRVPLIARWPGKAKGGGVAPEIVSGEDIAPTFLEAAGLPVPKEMSGKSFLPRLTGGAPFSPHPYVFSERGAHGSGLPRGTGAFDLGRCVISSRYKLIYNALWQLPYQPVDFGGQAFWKNLQDQNAAGKLTPEQSKRFFAPQRPLFELYDLQTDPWERNNLIDTPESAAIAKRAEDGPAGMDES